MHEQRAEGATTATPRPETARAEPAQAEPIRSGTQDRLRRAVLASRFERQQLLNAVYILSEGSFGTVVKLDRVRSTSGLPSDAFDRALRVLKEYGHVRLDGVGEVPRSEESYVSVVEATTETHAGRILDVFPQGRVALTREGHAAFERLVVDPAADGAPLGTPKRRAS